MCFHVVHSFVSTLCDGIYCINTTTWERRTAHWYYSEFWNFFFAKWFLLLLFRLVLPAQPVVGMSYGESCGMRGLDGGGLCDAEIEMNQEMRSSWVKYRILLLLSIELYFGEAEITAKYVQPMEFLPYQWLTC